MCGFVLPTFSLPSSTISEFEVVEAGLGYYNYHVNLMEHILPNGVFIPP